MRQHENQKSMGSLRISKEVIASIAKISASEVAGVAGFAPATVDFKKIISKNSVVKPVTVSLNDDLASLCVYILIKNSAKIPTVAQKVQETVKESVQNMTGITVSKVDVVIAGVVFDN